MTRESYEDYMKRRLREEDAEYEERKWKDFEKHTLTMHNMANHVRDKQRGHIFESPDGGKTVYERRPGSTIRRLVRDPEEQKINEVRNIPSGWRELTPEDSVDFTAPDPDQKVDMVNHPPHYNKGIETTTYINSWDMGFSQGNVVKYVTRYNLKHDSKEKQLEDLKKARWYLEDVIKQVENE